ncbi:hypothetical protein [Moorella sp. Hama-1]|uniref:amino acid kinase family protein n=1 Tax=Moorella sp. Hama-1 TaxID=2138101 RepID=UPI000D656522|nr:hypothetical protein [Moorella sp. Hama-1]BCV21931.1 amino acid kinase [Moorella sp. Hama-1]
MRALTVVKIGGSLVYHENGRALRRLGEEIARLALAHSIVIVPGGGPFADVVREYGQRLGLRDASCHFMAVSSMDQYGYLLREFIPGSRLIELGEEGAGRRLAEPAFSYPVILLCSRFIGRVPPAELPRSWDVTSDSIAAYIAGWLGARLLVLLKSVDVGLEIKEPVVDAFFAKIVPPYLRVWVINGLYPERLTELLETGQTRGSLYPNYVPTTFKNL